MDICLLFLCGLFVHCFIFVCDIYKDLIGTDAWWRGAGRRTTCSFIGWQHKIVIYFLCIYLQIDLATIQEIFIDKDQGFAGKSDIFKAILERSNRTQEVSKGDTGNIGSGSIHAH